MGKRSGANLIRALKKYHKLEQLILKDASCRSLKQHHISFRIINDIPKFHSSFDIGFNGRNLTDQEVYRGFTDLACQGKIFVGLKKRGNVICGRSHYLVAAEFEPVISIYNVLKTDHQ